MPAQDVFKVCVEAIRAGELIHRVSSTDKEFHFQNWFKARLEHAGQNFEIGGRNSYPDFRMVATTDGYELKGLAYPGRDASFDSNSQVPTGSHNGRAIYYVFGRYPKQPDGNAYPVLDLVVCHGDFLNADHDYVHHNKSVKGFGSYGDLLIRDRKMYVVPTPFRLVDGVAHRQTLILPADVKLGEEFVRVGELCRREADELVIAYSFDLQTNDLRPTKVPNPHAGREHQFQAWRLKGSPTDPVAMRELLKKQWPTRRPTMTTAIEARLIESDVFPFEFLSHLAERESWRKEIHRPIYHVHKWWAKRLGSVFRGMLLGCQLPTSASLATEFYRSHSFAGLSVFDPFMGSGTTIGEAHKLGFTALGRDINPVAVEAVTTALGPLNEHELQAAFAQLEAEVAPRIRRLYRSIDKRGRPCDVLYSFWVMQATCPDCSRAVDLFPSFVIARNAYPDRKPEVQVYCPNCGDIAPGLHGDDTATCAECGHHFDPSTGTARGTKGHCGSCNCDFKILDVIAQQKTRPAFRLYGKLVLTKDGRKEYLRATADDLAAYEQCSVELRRAVEAGELALPDLALEYGHNTRQAMGYGFTSWRDFFNDRQLLALVWLRDAILKLDNPSARRAMLTLFSGVLEFNNLFASYKGEGTGAVRHMFSHHILKPERTPIEANVWGTPKSSGSFSTLFPSRLLRAVQYRKQPSEVNGHSGEARTCSPAFSGRIEPQWPTSADLVPRGIYLSCGDSSITGLDDQSIDLVVTDPPFFDNVHYSELADFFFAWQQIGNRTKLSSGSTTRHLSEVQDADADKFAEKLQAVFRECHRVLRDDGLLVFSYHHSRHEGWASLAKAILGAGFLVVNSQPVKAEMSVATPKSAAKEPIQFDIILVCRKRDAATHVPCPTESDALASARKKLLRLYAEGFTLSLNDRRIVLLGQLLTLLRAPGDFESISRHLDDDIHTLAPSEPFHRRPPPQKLLFEDA